MVHLIISEADSATASSVAHSLLLLSLPWQDRQVRYLRPHLGRGENEYHPDTLNFPLIVSFSHSIGLLFPLELIPMYYSFVILMCVFIKEALYFPSKDYF